MADMTVMLARVHALIRADVAWDTADWSEFSDVDKREVLTLTLYELERTRGPKVRARRRALRLFRSWLTRAQNRELTRRQSVVIRGSAGGRYRVHPWAGRAERVERHGRRWFARVVYCLHPPDVDWPDPDIALAHLLMLATDEPAFLNAANAYPRDTMWDGTYLRQMREARLARTQSIPPAG